MQVPSSLRAMAPPRSVAAPQPQVPTTVDTVSLGEENHSSSLSRLGFLALGSLAALGAVAALPSEAQAAPPSSAVPASNPLYRYYPGLAQPRPARPFYQPPAHHGITIGPGGVYHHLPGYTIAPGGSAFVYRHYQTRGGITYGPGGAYYHRPGYTVGPNGVYLHRNFGNYGLTIGPNGGTYFHLR